MKKIVWVTLVALALVVLGGDLAPVSARGGRGGGGGGRVGGGGGGGGAARGTPSMSRAAPRPPAAARPAARPAGGAPRASAGAGGARPGAGARPATGAAGRGAGAAGRGTGAGVGAAGRAAGGRAATHGPGGRPTASDLSSFLGLPGGAGGAAAGAAGAGAGSRAFGSAPGARTTAAAGTLPAGGNRTSNVWQGDHFTIGTVGGSGSVTGPGGVTVGGAGRAIAIQGPGGNTVVRGAGAIGATNGINSVGRAGGFVGVQGRYGNRAVAGRGAVFANGQLVGGRTWSAVNGNFTHWNAFGPGWYGRYPRAWYPGRWAAASVWTAATWAALSGFWGYGSAPMYYDYGGDVGYSDGQVYYGDEPVATEEQYYNEATDIAAMGAQEPAADDEWMPLGVFGIVTDGQTDADKLIQLAVNKAGLIRGNYHDLLTDQVLPVEGAVDGKTQRAAFHLQEKPEIIVETGIYNLTNDEVPVLVHYAKDRTEQRTLVRLQNPEESGEGSAGEGAPADAAAAEPPAN